MKQETTRTHHPFSFCSTGLRPPSSATGLCQEAPPSQRAGFKGVFWLGSFGLVGSSVLVPSSKARSPERRVLVPSSLFVAWLVQRLEHPPKTTPRMAQCSIKAQWNVQKNKYTARWPGTGSIYRMIGRTGQDLSI